MTAVVAWRTYRTDTPAFAPLPTNLPGSGAAWLQLIEGSGATIAAEGLKADGTSAIRINTQGIAGKTLTAIAFGVKGSPELYYANSFTFDPNTPLNLTAAVGPTPQFTPTQVAGQVQVDGTAVANRTVRAFSYYEVQHAVDGSTINMSKSLGHSVTDDDGHYAIELERGFSDPVFVVAFDDEGTEFSPGMSVQNGDRVRPTTRTGYVYVCESAGDLPDTEPDWVADTNTSKQYGTAAMIAVPFYRPMVHGPITPEVVDDGTSASG